jgi:hypothetical protein
MLLMLLVVLMVSVVSVVLMVSGTIRGQIGGFVRVGWTLLD